MIRWARREKIKVSKQQKPEQAEESLENWRARGVASGRADWRVNIQENRLYLGTIHSTQWKDQSMRL